MYCMELNRLIKFVWNSLERMNRSVEDTCQRSEGMLILINQVVFFMLCDHWFCPEDRLTGLYSLLFYNVISYLVYYAKNVINVAAYTPFVRVSEHSNIRHLAMSATKIVLDLTKAVTFVITGVFMLLVFGLEQGLEHFNPTCLYILVTGVYFILSERASLEKIPFALAYFKIDMMENLESLWTPVIGRLVTSLSSLLMVVLVWFWTEGSLFITLIATYINVYLGLKAMDRHLKVLLQERACLNKYRFATYQELSGLDDVCSVCLQRMTCARVTPCHHMFHGDCLRRSLKDRSTCPMCKQEL